jgi:hypothetical protein
MNPFGPTRRTRHVAARTPERSQAAPSRRGEDPPFGQTLPGDPLSGSTGPSQPAETAPRKLVNTQLGPEAYRAQMMALYFLSVGLGTSMSGVLAEGDDVNRIRDE